MKTEEEKKEAKREYDRQRYRANKKKVLERQRRYRKENAEKVAEQHKQYYQANKERIAEQHKRWRKKNPDYGKMRREKNPNYFNLYYQANKERIVEQQKQYRQTPFGRASYLINGYKREDKKYNRGKCTLTAQWIVDNIFTKKCVYCGESDWTKLGCDRIDNSKPHTEDNVVCCCGGCNKKRGTKDFVEYFANPS